MPKINLGKVVGEKGDPFTYEDFTQAQLEGITPKLLKGNVTTLNPDENATVNIRKEGLNNYIDLGIPRGKNGAEIKNISAENVVMTDGDTLEDTIATVSENIDNLNAPTFDDSTGTYATLTAANTAAETASNAIKNKVSIFTTLSNMKKSFSAIIQGLKILGTNVGMITGITSDLNSESDTIAASSKALATLNSNLNGYLKIFGTTDLSSDSASRKPRGVYESAKFSNEALGIPEYSILYKIRDADFEGSFLICRQSNGTYGGMYTYRTNVGKFVKLALQS